MIILFPFLFLKHSVCFTRRIGKYLLSFFSSLLFRRQAGYDRVIQVVSRAVEQLIQNNGLLPRYALRLTESGHITQDNMLPPAELKRRAVLKAMCVKAVVKFNGRVVTSTDYHPLRVGSMSVDFNKYFEFRVLHQPSDVTIDLYTKKVFSFFILLVSIFAYLQPCLLDSTRYLLLLIGKIPFLTLYMDVYSCR